VATGSLSGAEATTVPSPSSTTADVIWDESSVSSRSACAASIAPTLATSRLACSQQPRQLASGLRAMRVRHLPRIPELRDRERLADGHEDRVVTEPLAAAPFLGDRPFERSRGAQLRAVRGEDDQLADIAGAAVSRIAEFEEHLRHPVLRPARRADTRPAVKGVDLDP